MTGHYYTPAQWSCWGVYWFHSVRRSVHPSRIPCPLCSACSSGWIHFIFIYLIKQLQKVCMCKVSGKIFKNLNFWQFFKICNFDFVLFWFGIWCESLVWVIMGWRGVSQNAGVLVVLVQTNVDLILQHLCASSVTMNKRNIDTKKVILTIWNIFIHDKSFDKMKKMTSGLMHLFIFLCSEQQLNKCLYHHLLPLLSA